LLYVADGTRPETLQTARTIREQAEETVGGVPSLLLLNKSDLAEAWSLDDAFVVENGPQGLPVYKTSARTGDHVEEAFHHLVERMLGG